MKKGIRIRLAGMGELSYVSYFNMKLYWEQYNLNPCFELYALDADYRGNGIGSALMDTAKAFCIEQGYTNVFLGTIDFLTDARRLYARYGFELTRSWMNEEWRDIPLKEERWELTKWK